MPGSITKTEAEERDHRVDLLYRRLTNKVPIQQLDRPINLRTAAHLIALAAVLAARKA